MKKSLLVLFVLVLVQMDYIGRDPSGPNGITSPMIPTELQHWFDRNAVG